MNQVNPSRLLALLAAAALLLSPLGVADAGPGGGRTALTLTFDDLPGDMIRSDGLGGYDARESPAGAFVVSTGKRAVHFDFSNALTWWSFAPFEGGAVSGDIDSISMTVSLVDATSGTVTFEFTGPDFDHGGTTDYSLSMAVSVSQSGDTYYLEAASEAELLYLYQQSGIRGNGHLWPPCWERAGIFDMPWGAQVSP